MKAGEDHVYHNRYETGITYLLNDYCSINDVSQAWEPWDNTVFKAYSVVMLSIAALMIPQGAFLCPQSHSAEQVELVSTVDHLLLC